MMVTGFSAGGEDVGDKWRKYSDASQRFQIEYPSATEPKNIQDGESAMLSHMAFEFEQPFRSGPDAGSLKFQLQISVWQNTNHLSAEEWARQHTNPKLILESRSARLAGQTGVVLRTTNLAWPSVNYFVADRDQVYELNYPDIAANKQTLTEELRAKWTATFNRMVESFQLRPSRAGFK